MPVAPSKNPDDEVQLQTPYGQSFRLSRRELKEMLRKNALAPGTMYFEEGMDGWQPLRGIRKRSGVANPALSSRRLQEARHKNPDQPIVTFARDPNRLTSLLKFFLWFYLTLCAAMVAHHLAQYLMLTRDFTDAEVAMGGLRQVILGLTALGVYLISFILFLKWVYRAYFNSMEFGVEDLKTTPGWAVGHYFIPIINFFRPYGTMQEIDQVSQNPNKWREMSPSFVVSAWWTLWLLSIAASQISSRLENNIDLNAADWAEKQAPLSLVSAGATVLEGLCIATMLALVTRITHNQNQLVEQSERLVGAGVDPEDPSTRKMPPRSMPPGADTASREYSPA